MDFTKTPIDPKSKKTIAIREMMKTNGEARHDANAVLGHVSADTAKLVESLQKKLQEVNEHMRKF